MNQVATTWAVLCALVTTAWVVVALGGGDPSPVATTAAGAAAAAGTAALVGAGWRVHSPGSLQAGGVLLAVLPAGVAALGRGSTALLCLVLAVVAAVEVAGAGRSGRRVSTAGDGDGDGGAPWWDPLPDPPHDRAPAEDPGPAADAGRAGPGRPRRVGRRRVVPGRDAVLVAGGCLLIVVSFVAVRADTARWVLPGERAVPLALALAGAGLLVLAGALGPPRARALAVPALSVALPVAAHLPAGTAAAVAGAVAVTAGLVAARRPGLALAALAVAAAASSPELGPTAPLLAAAAALSLAVEYPVAAALGLPGAAALAALVVPPGRSGPAVVVAAAAAVTALALAARVASGPRTPPLDRAEGSRAGAPDPWAGTRPGVEAAPALVLGAWLVVAPGTWAWTGIDGTGPYDRGAAVAVAAGSLALVVATIAESQGPARHVPPTPPSPVVPARPPRRRHRRRAHAIVVGAGTSDPAPARGDPAPAPGDPAPAPGDGPIRAPDGDDGPAVVPNPPRRQGRPGGTGRPGTGARG